MTGSNTGQTGIVMVAASVASLAGRIGIAAIPYGLFFGNAALVSWAMQIVVISAAVNLAVLAGSAAADWAEQTTSSAAGKIKFWGKGSKNE